MHAYRRFAIGILKAAYLTLLYEDIKYGKIVYSQ